MVDERGGIEGLVTPSDAFEALVGDLEDPNQVVRRDEGSWLVDGLLDAEELRELTGMCTLPDEQEGSYQTVGEMAIACLGRVPAEGDHSESERYSFKVVDMDGHRVDKVLVTRESAAADAPQE